MGWGFAHKLLYNLKILTRQAKQVEANANLAKVQAALASQLEEKQRFVLLGSSNLVYPFRYRGVKRFNLNCKFDDNLI